MKALFVATVDVHLKSFHTPYMKWLKERGFEVHAASSGSADIAYCDVKYDLPFKRTPFSADNVKAARELGRIAGENKYDLIHFHTPVAGMFGRWAVRKQRKRGTRVLYTAHGFHFYKGAPAINWLMFYPAERFMARYTDGVITMNGEDYARALKFGSKAYKIPGMGVDLNKFRPAGDEVRKKARSAHGIENGEFAVLSVGELNENKNHAEIVKAVGCRNQKICYLIAGEGEKKAELMGLAKSLGVKLHLLGRREDTCELYAAADAFAFPSRREGLPISLMEAMASGLACVASDIRGNRDLIVSGKNGLLVADGRYERACSSLINDEGLRAALGLAARESMEEYSVSRALEAMAEIYSEVMGL